MMRRVLCTGAVVAVLAVSAVPTLAQAPPSTVFIEAMTWEEIRDQIADGKTTVIAESPR